MSPFLTIFYRPRLTLRRIIATDPRAWTLSLIMLESVSRASNVDTVTWSERLPPALLRSFYLAFSPLLAVAILYAWGGLLTWTGRWLGGKGRAVQLRAALAWSSLPSIAWLIVSLAAAPIAGNWLLGVEPAVHASAGAVAALSMAELAFGLWRGVLSLLCVAEAHAFSVARALGAWLLGVAVGVSGLVGLSLTIWLARP